MYLFGYLHLYLGYYLLYMYLHSLITRIRLLFYLHGSPAGGASLVAELVVGASRPIGVARPNGNKGASGAGAPTLTIDSWLVGEAPVCVWIDVWMEWSIYLKKYP